MVSTPAAPPPATQRGPRAVLVGLPGTGKTTCGRRLARILAVGFADSDELIETAGGDTVATIFAERGEAEFRRLEAAVIRAALVDFDGVLALGGGALLHPATRAALRASAVPVVLLRAPLGTLAGRVGDAASRPLLVGAPRQRLFELSAQRDAAYRSAATLVVDTGRRDPGQVAAHIAARLHERRAASPRTPRVRPPAGALRQVGR